MSSKKRPLKQTTLGALLSPKKPSKASKTDKKASEDELRNLLAIDCESDEFTCPEDFQKCFDEISEFLLNRCYLMVAGVKHRLCEIEYYFNGKNHSDFFAHGTHLQLTTCGAWYFHTTGSGKSAPYKGGTYKGVDITFGLPDSAHGGILLRTIQEVNSEKVVEGSCNLVNHILSTTAFDSIAGLVASSKDSEEKEPETDTKKGKEEKNELQFHLSILKPEDVENSSLYILPADDLIQLDVIKSPRVGLTLKQEAAKKVDFILKPYRYLTLPKQIKKQKNTLVLALHEQGKSTDSIKSLTRSAKAETYVGLYEKGKKKRAIKGFYGTKMNVGAMCEFYGAYASHREKKKEEGNEE